MPEHDVIDTGNEILAETWDERGLHVLDGSGIEWVTAARFHPTAAREKVLCSPLTGADRPYISLVEMSPGSRTTPSYQEEGEFMMILEGAVTEAGITMSAGTLACRTRPGPAGPMEVGPFGCTLLVFRRTTPEGRKPATAGRLEPSSSTTLRVFELDGIAWRPPAVRPVLGQSPLLPEHDSRVPVVGEVWEKSLIYPLPGDDLFPVSIIRFPPDFRFHRHWHTDGEFVRILSGSANFAGRDLGAGAMAYNDARVVYGAEAAGPNGCDFVLIRRAWAETHLPGGSGEDATATGS